MNQLSLFEDAEPKKKNEMVIGHNLVIIIDPLDPDQVALKLNGIIIKRANFKDKVSKRVFIVETVELGCIKSQLASCLDLSRQTIHNYLETKQKFGLEGLVHGYTLADSKSLTKQRQLHSEQRSIGNKAKLLAEIRKKEKQERTGQQLKFDFSYVPSGQAREVEKNEQPFQEEHNWERTRYAGAFCYLITLISKWNWLDLVMGYFGAGYKIFMVFLLMAARNTRSIEQLKNVRSREAGIVTGIRKIASKPIVWQWFYSVADQGISEFLKREYFRYQLRRGIVGMGSWFIDGHLLPYTGHHKVHHGYNTQRRMPIPGQTNMVTCDENGRVIDFEIQEGKGEFCNYIASLYPRLKDELAGCPIMVFDREGYGAPFFSTLVTADIAFVTWDKNVDSAKLFELDDSLFDETFELNNRQYGVYEDKKSFTHTIDVTKEDKHSFTLRRINIWNKTSRRRTSGLAWTGDRDIGTKDCALAILSRWGASENTFKHIKDRHPFHYHPGFKLEKSERQEIKNPKIKEKEGLIAKCKKALARWYKQLTKSKRSLNNDGTPRGNSIRERIKSEIKEKEAEMGRLVEEKKELPEKIDPSSLEDYKSFKKIDNEGKNLFDFVTSSVWNARKEMVNWLRDYFNEENEVVDLFYAIVDCHGWVKSTKDEVIVRLEPLQQPKRRAAQEQLCRKLTSLGAMTPNGKWLILEIGSSPLT